MKQPRILHLLNTIYSVCRGEADSKVLVFLLINFKDDARVTYNELKDLFGVEVAEVVWACTEDAGRSRDERHGPAYFSRLRNNHVGVFVKLCDIMANSLYGAMTNSSMFRKQAKEWPHFKEETTEHHERFKPMYEFLNKLYEIN